MVDVCLPGTGGMMPLENRALTCCWIEYQGSAVLIDCGEGTQVALKKAGCKLNRLDTLLLTHFHADHVAGLPGLLLTLGNSGKTTALNIIGPVGLVEVVSALTIISPFLPYPLALYENAENESGEINFGGAEISWLPLNHRAPCLGYRIDYKRKPVFNPLKAGRLNIPKTFYHTLHSGNAVTLDDGRVIEPCMVLDGERPPVRICYCTDTLPVDAMADFAHGADLLISEGMHEDEALRDKMTEKKHMLFSDSARIAKAADVKRLWLTHFSPALIDPQENIENTRKIFANTDAAYDGIRVNL